MSEWGRGFAWGMLAEASILAAFDLPPNAITVLFLLIWASVMTFVLPAEK